MGTGVVTGDFTQILNDFTRALSYQVSTKSTSGMGDETTSFATATALNMVFFKQECRYIFDKEGLLQVGDAYILAPIGLNVKRYDRFTVDGENYYIENVIRRFALGVAMLDYAVCFKV